MRKIDYKVIFILFALTFVLVFPHKVNAADTLNPETVFDYADLLTTDEEDDLRKYAEKFEAYKISVIFLTTDDALGKSSMNYSNDFYDTNHFRPDGVMFMIDMDNRNIYIDTVGTCIDILSESDIDRALDDSYSYAADGEYYTCFEKMSDSICTEIENHENPLLGAFRFSIVTLLIAAAITAIIIIILIVIHNQANQKTAAERYVGSSFKVNDRNTIYMGSRREVIPGYYKENTKSGGSGSHTSSGGVSHGGGGRSF